MPRQYIGNRFDAGAGAVGEAACAERRFHPAADRVPLDLILFLAFGLGGLHRKSHHSIPLLPMRQTPF